ncbi:MAG: DNA translocase FtsK [Bacteroidetes bacterium]|nr:MAG: DNA translocase FtsK [Bacteroidota bacterium]
MGKANKKSVKNALSNDEDQAQKPNKRKKKSSKKKSSLNLDSLGFKIKDERITRVSGIFLIVISLFLFISFVSYFISWFSWDADDIFSHISFSRVLFDQDIQVHNITGRLGASISQVFIKSWFGISSFLLLYIIALIGLRWMLDIKILSIRKAIRHSAFIIIWLSVTLGFFLQGPKSSIFGGIFGYETSNYFEGLIGKPGVILLILFSLVSFIIFSFNISKLFSMLKPKAKEENINMDNYEVDGLSIDELAKLHNDSKEEKDDEIGSVDFDLRVGTDDEKQNEKHDTKPKNENEIDLDFEVSETIEEDTIEDGSIGLSVENESPKDENNKSDEELDLSIVETEKEEILDAKEVERTHGIDTLYDPKEDLVGFKNPSIDLLEEHSTSNEISINKEELQRNKDKIVETLANYSIKIDKIRATVGPTITLYEIVPAPGVRISKIKNLEDDIAMSLAALGIRIIAPIPGRGTIGIEVPNANPEIISMKTIIASEKFQNAKFDLPVAIGKTISNETFVFDLAKMPHLLVAGATGQGKSVGLNAIITSLLYKKHPAQLKFVMVDPKKVEFSLFSKIEKHYLAKLPDRTDAIITDNKDVINTLNSLTIEMDDRYELLKTARARNLKEYNEKFINRKLNPENGHRYMPYIVLVVDEFADLIMTAGKEVEAPIARLAQLARAIGIHLIIATQRPSVNVITGMIKANFPARIAFRVTSKIDSRTILDAGGADQLIGRGDMLFSKGDGLVRLQCAFVDTPEVEAIVDFIGNQRGYASAFNLPEFVGDEDSGKADIAAEDRDVLFEDAARMIVNHQQGSTSLIQRKMKLGYNRAGRIIDQLEAANIVGPFGGSKARDVLIKDIVSLEQYLEDMRGGK